MITSDELNKIPIFACLEEPERQRFANKAADMHLKSGEWLIREGDIPYFYVLLEGDLALIKDVLGQPREFHRYKVGAFFGEVPILMGAPAFVSVQAKAWCRIARFDRQQLQELIRDSAACSAIILQTMNARLASVQEWMKEIPSSRVFIVGSQYDTDCRDIRSFLSMNRIPYEWVDREREPDRVPICLPKDSSGPAVIVDRAFCVGQPPTVRKVAEALGIRTTPTRENYDVVVIGGGPAGLAAAVYGASEGLCVLLIERNAAGGQAGTSSRIENYLGFPNGISGDELSERALRQAGRFGAEMVLTREVQNIEPMTGGYCVEMDSGDRVMTKTVILATGVDWRRLDAEGVDELLGRGVLYGAARTESPTVIGKDVFIVGGGNSAGQAAMFFSNYANSVTILVRGAGLHLSMSQYLIDQLASKKNISIEPFTQVVSVGGGDHLETLCTSTKGSAPQTRKADALFVLIGADANTGWLPKNLQRDEKGYICTGRDVMDLPNWNGSRPPFLLETNLPGFFCAGDVRHDSIKRVSSGVGEGSMAIAFVHQYLALDQKAN
ncbi:cyclic nucleotide-regulated FAD-dependent pyridine nucleotide-disulfide oxidoreductase [Granulicella mallensis MP5ACTX8]|uniref:Cyclic nucleotide-regulated FAD-dependent pyridine nucleotide-disulfide oxidoreductase n=2 Tax=Granulicella mallensis TaxID=940614 RepID=G8NTT2_GRAMM|nr:cyclic nucleotide-regulated FAD-dependent pyridine nucleotide-disulfide oxidoreductase [Granulicella mallensis MP5ACTX8]